MSDKTNCLNNLRSGDNSFYRTGGGYVEDIDRDEMRSGFLVTSHRKKLWNAQIGLMKEVARICQKHNIRWFAYAGTLLGAARHKGFIPWDDDIDVCMFRPEYEKFQSVVEDELKNHPYYSLWQWFNYRLETDEPSDQTDMLLPLISKEQQYKYPNWAPFHPMMRNLDNRTTFIMHDTRKHVFRSVFLDIFPLDPCPQFSDETQQLNFMVARELFLATVFSEPVRKALAQNQPTVIGRQHLENFLALPYKKRARLFELTELKNFSRTPCVGEIKYFSTINKPIAFKTQDFDETIYLPFETIELPAPKNFDAILTAQYGDWHKPVVTHTHANEGSWSTDIPYAEYVAKSAPPE